MRRVAIILVAGLASACQTGISPMVSRAPTGCRSPATITSDARQTIEAFYAALAKDDAGAFAAVTTADFVAIEAGKRFTGQTLFDSVAKAHRDGRIYVWNVGPLNATLDCRIATAVWVTTGSSGVPPKIEARAWLESATFVHQDGRWKISFLHSSSVNPKP